MRHFEALSETLDILALSPDSTANRSTPAQSSATFRSELIEGRGILSSRRMKFVADLESLAAGSSAPLDVRRAFSREGSQLEGLANAQIVEFQWSEMMSLAPIVRARHPKVPLVGIAHDVITQRWARAAEVANSGMRPAYRWAASRSRRREAESFAALDVVIVFSEKDAGLVKELSSRTRVEVVRPGLTPNASVPVAERRPSTSEPVVLFTGALNRRDNSDAVVWFLQNVWERVLVDAPSARFVVAGGGAPESLKRSVNAAPRAELTGYVDSLDPYYARASVFVVPLLTGAGVKFKTIDAMVRGVPVVTTPVGAEGIDRAGEFANIETRPAEFADGVIAALRGSGQDTADRGAVWARDAYGYDSFAKRLQELYAQVGVGR